MGPSGQQSLFLESFSSLQDPRRTNRGNFMHKLSDILLLTISAVLCGADDWETVELFGNSQLSWLKKYGDFSNGIPSSDTINRVFSAIDPKAFNLCFMTWVKTLINGMDNEIVPIDGKSIRGASPKNKNGMPHIVSAFAAKNNLCLGQVKVSSKSNEITAIPELLDLLFIKGCVVTIDAMGCQTDIAEKIIGLKADYLLAVKGNQGALLQAISDTVLLEKPETVDIQTDCGHGRIETRECSVYTNLGHIEEKEKWTGLNTIIKISTETVNKATGETTYQDRFYISSLMAQAIVINGITRTHWAIENNLHWNLDVAFNEDGSRKRAGNAATNFNIILKFALSMIVKETSLKRSKKNKRMQAALDPKYRDKLMKF